MAAVQSVTIQSDDGENPRRVIYEIVLLDNAGVEHSFVVGPVFIGNGADATSLGAARADRLLSKQAENENNRYATDSAIESGGDVLSFALNPQWSTTKEIAKRLIRWMMKERNPYIVLFLEPLIVYIQQNYTATQVAALLDITPTQVVRLNNRVNAILQDVGTVKSLLLSYDSEAEDIR